MSLLVLLAILIIVGVFTGILIGMFGIGGGIVFVPTLYYFLPLFDVPYTNLAYFTIGTSLFAGALATSNSAYLHIRKENFSKKPAILVSIGAAISAFIAPFFVAKINAEIIGFIFALVMIVVALSMIFENSLNEKFNLERPLSDPILFLLGTFTGVFSAFTGLGGGVIYVPALIYLFLINAKMAVGTSSIIAAITMISSAIAYILLGSGSTSYSAAIGFVIPEAAIPLGIGAIIGSFFGVKIVMRSSTELVKKAFGILLIAAVAKYLFT